MAISNVLSLLTCFLELMFYSGTVWGFSFLEYIFKEEKIFEKEKCENVDPAGNFKIFDLRPLIGTTICQFKSVR